MTSWTLSPFFIFRASSDSVVSTDAISAGRGLAPHLVCKTSVTVKDLPAEKRLVALIRCRGGFDSYCPLHLHFYFVYKQQRSLEKTAGIDL